MWRQEEDLVDETFKSEVRECYVFLFLVLKSTFSSLVLLFTPPPKRTLSASDLLLVRFLSRTNSQTFLILLLVEKFEPETGRFRIKIATERLSSTKAKFFREEAM